MSLRDIQGRPVTRKINNPTPKNTLHTYSVYQHSDGTFCDTWYLILPPGVGKRIVEAAVKVPHTRENVENIETNDGRREERCNV